MACALLLRIRRRVREYEEGPEALWGGVVPPDFRHQPEEGQSRSCRHCGRHVSAPHFKRWMEDTYCQSRLPGTKRERRALRAMRMAELLFRDAGMLPHDWEVEAGVGWRCGRCTKVVNDAQGGNEGFWTRCRQDGEGYGAARGRVSVKVLLRRVDRRRLEWRGAPPVGWEEVAYGLWTEGRLTMHRGVRYGSIGCLKHDLKGDRYGVRCGRCGRRCSWTDAGAFAQRPCKAVQGGKGGGGRTG